MKNKKQRKYNVPQSHSNLSEHETMRSHFDPNGSWTGTPEHDGYPDIPDGEKTIQQVEGAKEMPGYTIEDDIAPTDGKSYAQNTRNLVPERHGDEPAKWDDVESGSDIYDEPAKRGDVESGSDICDEPLWQKNKDNWQKYDAVPEQDADDL